MRNTGFAILLSGLLLSACQPVVKGKNGVEYKTAIAYQDYIASRQKDIILTILHFSRESKSNPVYAEHIIDSATLLAQQSITDIEGMPGWKGDTAFRNDAAQLFRFYKKTFTNDYKRIIALQKDSLITPEEETEYHKMVKRTTTTETFLDSCLKASQQAFATKNGLTLKDKSALQNEIDKMKQGKQAL